MNLEEAKEKINKLLALSSSPNECEAELAMTKATALMEAYHLNKKECINEKISLVYAKALKRDSYRDLLAIAISELYNVYPVHRIGNNWKAYERQLFYGEYFQAYIAAEMYAYLEKTIERMAKKNLSKKAKKLYRESYKIGIARKLYSRIIEMGRNVSWAPDREEKKKQIARYVNEQNPNLVSEKTDCTPINIRAMFRGEFDGQSINLNRQTTGSGGRLIGGV